MNIMASEKIGRNLKKKISQAGLSVHALEKKAGLKQSAVQNILYGKSKKPSLHLIESIAKVLNCTVSELLEENKVSAVSPEIIKEEKEDLGAPWNMDLYVETFNVIYALIKKKNILLPREKFVACSEEVYKYSLKTDKTKPDRHFADWIIDKSST